MTLAAEGGLAANNVAYKRGTRVFRATARQRLS